VSGQIHASATLTPWKEPRYPLFSRTLLSFFLSFFSFFLSLFLYGSTALCWTLALLEFLDLYIVGRTPWTEDQPVARPLPTHRTTQTRNKSTQTSMYRVGFEPMIPAFEWAKTVHALDRIATVIGPSKNRQMLKHKFPPSNKTIFHYCSTDFTSRNKDIKKNTDKRKGKDEGRQKN
jgi:hypothetical protein